MSATDEGMRFDYAFSLLPLRVPTVADACFGVSDARYRAFCVVRHKCPVPVAAMTRAECRAIYRDLYTRAGCAAMPTRALSTCLYVLAWMFGASTAIRAIQRALGVRPSGLLDARTTKRVNEDRNALVRPVVKEIRRMMRCSEYSVNAERHRAIVTEMLRYLSSEAGVMRSV